MVKQIKTISFFISVKLLNTVQDPSTPGTYTLITQTNTGSATASTSTHETTTVTPTMTTTSFPIFTTNSPTFSLESSSGVASSTS